MSRTVLGCAAFIVAFFIVVLFIDKVCMVVVLIVATPFSSRAAPLLLKGNPSCLALMYHRLY